MVLGWDWNGNSVGKDMGVCDFWRKGCGFLVGVEMMGLSGFWYGWMNRSVGRMVLGWYWGGIGMGLGWDWNGIGKDGGVGIGMD